MLSALVALLLATGGPLDVAPAGAGGVARVTVTNASVHPLPLGVGAAGGEPFDLGPVPGYGTSSFLVECVAGEAPAPPSLDVRIDRDRIPLALPPPDEAAPPALWLGTDPAGTAVLSEVLRANGVERIVRRAPAEMPASFAALRAAPFLVASAPDLAALAPAQRAAVEQAVAAGTTLVLATGEGGTSAGLVKAWIGVELGEEVHPGPAARAAVPKAIALRRLALGPESPGRPLVLADDRPLVVEAVWGLGRVRVLAMALDELESGAVAEAAFRRPPDELASLRTWLSDRSPPLADRFPLSNLAFGLIAGLAGLAALARRLPRVAAAGTVPLLGVALWLPPGGAPVAVTGARMALVPVGAGALVVGNLDLQAGRGGPSTLGAWTAPLALERARSAGACLVNAGSASAWVFRRPPGETTRVDYLQWLDHAPDTTDEAALDAPGAPLASILPVALDTPRTHDACRAWRRPAAVVDVPAPHVLPAPAAEPSAP